ncbi:inositol trisphosphate kinase-like protein [Thermochaetoides thermophila DSM 1495]|uniref:Kinase n=1 Tax=Chaetomium thermophilum (strain DSM 1495 / CBS 144.50 / IMI 039719) TaxID=759272 RepID=G0S6Z8_CHATD|nr:inositol trisphosphate kinase-like protein [Thermochaetoides thermophila DSM 1495]EGS21696.1 inositol trisphosphate kinase-like protein [Thermochaetoides thermophila DSM 1495]
MAGIKELPSHADLKPFNHAAAGHEGTLSDPDGMLFIKPCTQQEIDFYEKAREHPDFAELMPEYLGTLSLNPTGLADDLEKQVTNEITQQAAAGPSTTSGGSTWQPNKNRKLVTDKSVVLENTTYGYKKPNILDAKLGIRLWADDAPLEKRQRFDEISRTTTSGSHGFRIAGMRVYKGSDDPADLDDEGFKVYDKNFGRFEVNGENLVDAFRKFIFNPRAGIDEDLGKAVAEAFLVDLKKVEKVLSANETRMYSASLLFTFEGDGEALRSAIEKANEEHDALEKVESNKDVDTDGSEKTDGAVASSDAESSVKGKLPDVSGPIEGDLKVIEMTGSKLPDDDDDEDVEMTDVPKIYSLKLIDFAHAEWVPGQGPDENNLFGIRNLIKIFEELVK